jgi:putative ABC transport system substrate-binding protein
MRRRDFIGIVGSAAAWPLAARAQQPAMPVVGFLAPVSQNEELLHGFQQGLQRAGFVEGDNVSILYRSADNEMDRLPALAIDLARRGVAVIVAVGQQAAFAAKDATATIQTIQSSSVLSPASPGLVAT